MKNSEAIMEMYKMQEEYDNMVFKTYLNYTGGNSTLPSFYQVSKALFDELGEVNHELKAEWCWWKKTQAPVNKDRLLEEIIDCFHFALCLVHILEDEEILKRYCRSHFDWKTEPVHTIEAPFDIVLESYYDLELNPSEENLMWLIDNIIYFAMSRGYSFEEFCECYKYKNMINRKRVENGY